MAYNAETIANHIEGGTWISIHKVSNTDTAMMRYNLSEFGWYDTFNKYCRVIDYRTGEATSIPLEYANWALTQSVTDPCYELTIPYPASVYPIFTAEEQAETRKQLQRDRLQEIIKSRSFPGIIIKPSRHPLPSPLDIREQRARETLRRIIGEEKWRNFVKNGFVSVQAKSGRIYQIFPGHGMTRVYENGRRIETLCVVMRGNFPATDSLITRFLMILNDEKDFWNRSIKHGIPSSVSQLNPKYLDNRSLPLTEVARTIRSA